MSLGDTKGIIYNIQRFSIHDGPGIRTTVFMKGCPLKCVWCHNPESIEKKPEIAYYQEKCICCGACTSRCPLKLHATNIHEHIFTREGCTLCGSCTQACHSKALEIIGRELTATEVLFDVKKDEAFYRSSGGGMTLSGGEPLLQPNFTLALLMLAKNDGLHTCVDTCGAIDYEILCKVAEFTDIFLFDIKETNTLRHKEYTGVSNEVIIENLKKLDKLCEKNTKIVLRCPIIPGLNDNEAHFANLYALTNQARKIDHIDIVPYHPLGVSKWSAIDKKPRHSDTSMPSEKSVANWVEFMQRNTQIPVLVR